MALDGVRLDDEEDETRRDWGIQRGSTLALKYAVQEWRLGSL